jgi:hypothetical protein
MRQANACAFGPKARINCAAESLSPLRAAYYMAMSASFFSGEEEKKPAFIQL